jgi:hypothetical protein
MDITHTHPAYPNEQERDAALKDAMALLQHMTQGVRRQVEDLHELAHSIDGDAESLIHDACVDLQVGCEKLDEALRLLKGE